MDKFQKIFTYDKEDLTSSEKLVLTVIYTYSQGAPVEFSYDELAKYTSLSNKSAYNIIKSLLEKDLLRVEKTEGKSNVYILNI